MSSVTRVAIPSSMKKTHLLRLVEALLPIQVQLPFAAQVRS